MPRVNAQTVKLLTLNQLDQRIKQGRDTTYIVNFWATWCAPCLKELPYFEKLGANLKNKKVKIFLVSADTKSKLEKAVIPLAKRLKLKNEVFLLNEKSQQVYIDRVDKSWSGALPATLFINKAKRKREFYEKEFTYAELLKTYNSI
ncbi:TlpA disulfide reductase family protein [Daejeonella lutea]|nr:TlpA disulfide reductase family protein [Daejeonella lutea]